MTLGRREFLQRIGAALAVLGISDTTLVGLSNTYQRAFADSSRCLALLVGINNYSPRTWQDNASANKGSFLRGALNDVELQRELLIHRFGVLPKDIVILLNDQATVSNILATVQSHIADQAKAGDTVVFHFSGLGSQVHLSEHPDGEYLPTLVTADSKLTEEDVQVIQDLFEESLVQLLADLRGVNLLTVIDASSSHYKSALMGNFRVRSRPVTPSGIWQAPFDPRLQEPQKPPSKLAKSWPGLLLRPSQIGKLSLEGSWNGFNAGLFTYALTQQIWSSLPAQRQRWFISQVEQKMAVWTGTNGTLPPVSKSSPSDETLPLVSGRLPKPATDGVVKTVDTVNSNAIVWLGGLPAMLLPYCELGLKLQPQPGLPGLAAVPTGTLVIKNMDGLRARAVLKDIDSLVVGTPVIEIERRLPKDIALMVAIDPQLERVERVDATSALSGLSYVTTASLGERYVDCLFGEASAKQVDKDASQKTDSGEDAKDTEPTSITSGYGLFTPDYTLIPGTAAAEEAVKTAVGRLQGLLRSLLAVKLLRLTLNAVSSRLPLRVTLTARESDRELSLIEETLRSRQFMAKTTTTQKASLSLNELPKKAAQQYQLELLNSGQQPLYYVVLSVMEKSQLSIYCPPTQQSDGDESASISIEEMSQLVSGEPVLFPRTADSSFSLQPLQAMEVFVIACTQPFEKTWAAVQTEGFRQMGDRWASIPEPLSVANAILRDIDRAGRESNASGSSSQTPFLSLRSDAWASLSL